MVHVRSAGPGHGGLAEDAHGHLWIGTRHGLNRLQPDSGGVRRYLHDPARPDSLAHDYVRPLHVDAAGTLWVGTYGGGLDRYDPAQDGFVHHRHDPARADSLSDDRVYALLADRDGDLWVGTHGGGLNRLAPPGESFTRFRHAARDPHSLANDRVLSLQQDVQGTVWVGTGAGLDRVTDAGFEHIGGLQHNVIYGIADDDTGQLWLSTDDGIVRFDPARRTLQRYPMRELWGNSEFNGGVWHRGRSGRLYFGGISGVVRVAPDRIAQDHDATRVVLTDFTLFNRSVANEALDPDSPLPRPIQFADHITLDHTQAIFGFGFAALRASSPERRRFAYRLEGFHERWLESAGRKRDATFTGVPAGDYRFRVRATGADGEWLADEAQLDITILPAPWRSAAAYAAYAAALLALFGFLARQRWRRLATERRAQRVLAKSE
jgi:ligand-binding sensor domain-containing protein